MSELRVKIDNRKLNNQPFGLEDIDLEVSFSNDNKTFLTQPSSVELTFTGDGYELLYQSFLKDGFNGVHNITIQKKLDVNTFESIYTGTLFISDVTFDIDKGFADVEVMDNSYAAFIQNNRGIKMNFTVDKTKNGFDLDSKYISSPDVLYLTNPPLNTVPATGLNAGTGTYRYVWRAEVVLKYLAGFMSDNRLDFESAFLDDSETKYGIISGYNLRVGILDEKVNNNISFENLWTDISRALNLVISVDSSTGTEILKAESLEYYRDSEVGIKKKNVAGIKQSTISELLYSKIGAGGNEAIKDGSVGDLEYIPPFDFAKDEYNITGTGNLASTIELGFTTLIADSNIIEDVTQNDNDQYDDDWFIISYTRNSVSGFNESTTPLSDIFNNGEFYFNGDLINKNIVQRYKFQGAAVNSSGDSDGDLIAYKGANQYLPASGGGTELAAPWKTGNYNYDQWGYGYVQNFDNVVLDPSGAWDTSLNEYTAVNNGVVNINISIANELKTKAIVSSGANRDVALVIKIRIMLNGVWLTEAASTSTGWAYVGESVDRAFQGSTVDGTLNEVNLSTVVSLQSGDVLKVYALQGYITYQYPIPTSGLLVSTMGNVVAANYGLFPWVSGGDVEVSSNSNLSIVSQGSITGVPILDKASDQIFINRFEFEESLTSQEISNFLISPQKAIILQNQPKGINTKVWVYNVAVNIKTGKTRFETFNNIAEL